MNTEEFEYFLPPERIAQEPVSPRDASRLLVVDRAEEGVSHRSFRDLPGLLRAGDLLVLNDTRVIPARLMLHKKKTGGRVEVFLLEERAPAVWEVLIRASRRPRAGAVLDVPRGGSCRLLEDLGDGRALVQFETDRSVLELAESFGQTPLPPYIRRPEGGDPANDRERYQTIYARAPGSVAAPTAGLHFTSRLFDRLHEAGVGVARITLHVGIGTFRPVTAHRVEDHRMEAERYEVPPEAAGQINEARAGGGRVIAVGSTSVRTLETVADERGRIVPGRGRSDLFIRPGHRFRAIDGMVTNFHLPCSTLLMMVCAFAGRERVLEAYGEAVAGEYRFYSYGDAMLLV